MTRTLRTLLVGAALLPAIALLPIPALAETGLPAVTIQSAAGGGQTYSLTIQVLLLMTAVTMLPAILLMMTAFTRIVIVLGILRQAIGAGNTPPNQVMIGLALFLTLFVMSPVVERITLMAGVMSPGSTWANSSRTGRAGGRTGHSVSTGSARSTTSQVPSTALPKRIRSPSRRGACSPWRSNVPDSNVPLLL